MRPVADTLRRAGGRAACAALVLGAAAPRAISCSLEGGQDVYLQYALATLDPNAPPPGHRLGIKLIDRLHAKETVYHAVDKDLTLPETNGFACRVRASAPEDPTDRKAARTFTLSCQQGGKTVASLAHRCPAAAVKEAATPPGSGAVWDGVDPRGITILSVETLCF